MSEVSEGDGSRGRWQIAPEQAIPQLLDQHGGRIHSLARRLCGSESEADDLVQEVFLAAFRHWDSFSGRRGADIDPRPWLFTIAAHACQRMHRKRAGEPARMVSLDADLPFGAPEVGVADGDGGGLSAAMRSEARDALQSAIVDLPIEYRLPLVLKDIVGMSLDQVAGILAMPLGTVKTRVHRARLRLRSALDSVLPRRELPPAAYPAQVCLDLLTAKQEALDHGVPMPGGEQLICERCKAVFQAMDLGAELCRTLVDEPLAEGLRVRLLQQIVGGRA